MAIDISGSGPWCVTVIESERGWGRKVDEYRRFATEQEAREWAAAYNRGNPAGPAPDWYMQAETVEYLP